MLWTSLRRALSLPFPSPGEEVTYKSGSQLEVPVAFGVPQPIEPIVKLSAGLSSRGVGLPVGARGREPVRSS